MKRSALTTSNRAEQILTRKVAVDFGGNGNPDDILTVVVSTPALQRAASQFDALEEGLDDEDQARVQLAETIAPALVSWNLTETDEAGNDVAVDPTAEYLTGFSSIELIVLLTALMEDLKEANEGKAQSSASSKPSKKPAKTPRKS